MLLVDKEKNDKFKEYNVFVYVLVFGFFTYINIAHFSDYICRPILIIFEVALLICVVFTAVFYKKINPHLLYEIAPVVMVVWLIWILGTVKWSAGKNRDYGIAILGICALTFLSVMYMNDIISKRREFANCIKNNLNLLIVCTICLILASLTILDVNLYDAEIYASKISSGINNENFDLVFSNVSDYCLYHTTNGISLFILLGELIKEGYGYRLCNIALYIVSIYCFGKIVEKIWCKNNKILATLETMMYSFLPCCIGLITNNTLDTSSLYLEVILIYAYVYKLEILMIITGWFFCNTKEPNAVYYLFFVFVIWIFYIKDELANCEKVVAIRFQLNKAVARGGYLLIPVFSWLINYFRKDFDDAGIRPRINETPISIFEPLETHVHCIGFTWANMIQKFKEIFIYNFNWLLVLFIVISLTILLIKKEGLEWSKEKSEFMFIIVALLMIVVMFNIFYLDYDNPRYVITASVPLILIFLNQLNSVCKNNGKIVITSLCSLCMLIQSYFWFDPITVIGTSGMIHTGRNNDEFAYNRSCQALQSCLRDLMEDVDWREEEIGIKLNNVQPNGYTRIFYDKKLKIITSRYTSDCIYINYMNPDEYDYYLYPYEINSIDLEGKELIGTYHNNNLTIECYKNNAM